MEKLDRRPLAPLTWAWALLAISTGPCASVAQQAAPTRIFVSDRIVAHLDSIADTATIEHLRCLIGGRQGDSLFVIQLYSPRIAHADYNTVTPRTPCPAHITVGSWHNHIPFNVPLNDPHNRTTPVEPWSVCEMSPPDRMVRGDPPEYRVYMISVAWGVHCAWVRALPDTLWRLPWRAAP